MQNLYSFGSMGFKRINIFHIFSVTPFHVIRAWVTLVEYIIISGFCFQTNVILGDVE